MQIYRIIIPLLFFIFIAFSPPAAYCTEDKTSPSTGEEVREQEKGITDEIFERQGGYIHPFISISEYYSDNIFNTSEDEKGDLFTVISPGIWFASPRSREHLLTINSSNIAPGGFFIKGLKPDFFRRYQTYLYYRADFERFSDFSSEDTISHTFEGLMQLISRGGLSLDIADQYKISHDPRSSGISNELDKFKTNLFHATLSYPPTEKITLRGDYTNFLVYYDSGRNHFRDRVDNAFSGYLYYKIRPKTDIFVEYEFIDIDYEEDILSNSQEHHIFGGITWNMTAKSTGMLKAGYGIKNFADTDISKSKDFIFKGLFNHRFTPKTSLTLFAIRRTSETNISSTDYVFSKIYGAEILQALTTKIDGHLNFTYTDEDYRGDLLFGSTTKERDDQYYSLTASLEYKYKRWLGASAGYIYTRRESNFPDFDYTNNAYYLRLTLSL